MKSGPEALAFKGTLFRITEIAWLKAAGLTKWELAAKILLATLGLLFVWAVARAKGSYYNVEGLLALFAFHAAFLTRGETRLASTGDFEESYEDRGQGPGKVFREWIQAVKENNPHFLAIQRDEYHYLINPARIAWVRPTWGVRYYPLFLAVLFAAYAWLINQGFDVSKTPMISDVKLLYFMTGGLGLLTTVCYLLVAVSLFALGVSFWMGVELTAPGGVHDALWLSSQDRRLVVEVLAGRRAADEQSVPARARRQAEPVTEPPPEWTTEAPVEPPTLFEKAARPSPREEQPAPEPSGAEESRVEDAATAVTD